MFKNFVKKIKKFYNIKFFFNFPSQKNILLYDEIHSLILKETINKDFNILKIRDLEIYFWIFLKQIIFFDFKFYTYCKNYIRYTKPKVIITFNERKPLFFDLKILPQKYAEAEIHLSDLLNGDGCVNRSIEQNWKLAEI